MTILTHHNARTRPTMAINNSPSILKLPTPILSGFDTLDFQLPPTLEAGEPPEVRGLARDEVRLMVSHMADDQVTHTQFRQLPDFLTAGDVVVINTSGTLNAAVHVTRSNGTPLELHLSTQLPDGLYVIELRRPNGTKTEPFFEAQSGERADDAEVMLLYFYIRPYHASRRLWVAELDLPMALNPYLTRHGFPIRYSYVADAWPGTYYQTVFATELGSAEMPSAGRAFTPELITRLVAKGVVIAPLVLHTGVASLEAHEPPYAEYYHVPEETARQVNLAHETGTSCYCRRDNGGSCARDSHAYRRLRSFWYWLDRVGHHTRTGAVYAVDAMLTGLHEPEATHLAMLEALAGRDHLTVTYAEALAKQYLWHEFGDLHLLLP